MLAMLQADLVLVIRYLQEFSFARKRIILRKKRVKYNLRQDLFLPIQNLTLAL